MAYWGYHLMVEAGGCDLGRIKDKKNVEQFSKTLVDRIEMVAHGKPQVVKFGEGDKAGFTLVQLIETSNITAHFCDSTREIYLDVFSCKPFDTATVLATLEEYFRPEATVHRFLRRAAPGRLP